MGVPPGTPFSVVTTFRHSEEFETMFNKFVLTLAATVIARFARKFVPL